MTNVAKVPRWAQALWGLVLVLLNAFLVVYVIGFASMIGLEFTGVIGRTPFGALFTDERAFGAMFAIVALSVLLSFALMGLSLAHILAWSDDLTNERKLTWAAAVFIGMQPAMLAYWYLHVWRSKRPEDGQRAPRAYAPSRAWLVVVGILTMVPPLYFVAFFLLVGFAATLTGAGGSGDVFRWLPLAHMGVILLCFALTAVYLIDLFRNPRLEGATRAIWALIIALGGPVGWPVYWYMNMWRPAPPRVSDAEGGLSAADVDSAALAAERPGH